MPERSLSSGVGRRSFLKWSTAATAAAVAGRAVAQPAQRPPNLVLIVAEDMGVEVGCYGDRTVPTRHLDALAAGGVLFENAYVTQASCSPSRSSILTGLYPHQNFQLGLAHYGYHIHAGIPHLPGLLKARGYRSGVAGKIHVGKQAQFAFDAVGTKHSKDIPAYGKWVRSFLAEDDGRPVFLYVNFGDAHKPFVRQVNDVPESPVAVSDVRPFPAHQGLDDPEVLAETAGYYHSVQRVDAGVGLVMDALRDAGLLENTLVMFIGDHGPPVARAKTTTYEFGIRIPMIVSGAAAMQKGLRSTALVSTVDILPTFATAAGIPLPRPLAGKPLQPLLKGETAEWRGTVCAEWHTHGVGFAPQRCIRDERYKLILNLRTDAPKAGAAVDGSCMHRVVAKPAYDGTPVRRVFDLLKSPPPVELYDLREDPIEYVNLAGDPAYRQIEERLQAQLHAWRVETRDPFLDPAAIRAQYDHLKARAAQLPALRKKFPKRKRFGIDMTPFHRTWADVVREDYGL